MDWLLSVPATYRWVITLAFVGIIVGLSVAPGVSRPDDTLFSWFVLNASTPLQKSMHVVVYALLAGLWMWTLDAVESRFVRAALTLVLCTALGGVLEWHQTRVPGRFGTLADVLLNIAGAAIGLLAALLFL